MDLFNFDPMFFVYAVMAIIIVWFIIYIFGLRRVVPPKFADVVTRNGEVEIYSADATVTKNNKPNTVYYHWNEHIPRIGVNVKRMSLENMEIKIMNYKTFAKGNARFVVDVSVYCRVNNVLEAAQRFPGNTMDDFKEGIKEIIIAAVRRTTANFPVEDVISKRQEIAEEVMRDIKDDMLRWGVEIINVSIVDFKDPEGGTTVIHDISAKKEAEINSLSRQEIANKKRAAEITEAETRQQAETRKLEADEVIGKRDQEKQQNIAIEQQKAVTKQMEVKRTQEVTTAEIMAEASVKKADGERRAAIEIAEGQRQKLELEGQGQAAAAKAVGEANAAVVLATKSAEAEGLSKYADAQKKQQEFATKIRVIEKDERVGLKFAEALAQAQIKYIGSGKPKEFIDLFTPGGGMVAGAGIGSFFESMKTTNVDGYNKLISVINSVAEGVGDSIDKILTHDDNSPSTQRRGSSAIPPPVLTDAASSPPVTIPYDKKARTDADMTIVAGEGEVNPPAVDQSEITQTSGAMKKGGIQKKKK